LRIIIEDDQVEDVDATTKSIIF